MHELHICGAAARAEEPHSKVERDGAPGARVSGAEEPRASHADSRQPEAAAQADDLAPTLPAYLLPPPRITGAEWGLGVEETSGVDAALADRVKHLTALKRERGIHFNQSIAKSRAFHNPRIYEKLVKWAGLEETGTNHPAVGTAWDPHDPRVLAYGNAPRRSAQQQRYMDEREKRGSLRRIDFAHKRGH